ncbi:MAG: hypothetical protein ACLFNK_00025 [Candidatus Woesearchaeota archaeon]
MAVSVNDMGKNKSFIKKVIALIAVIAALVNLVLMAMGKIEPHVFMIVVLFLFLLSYTYYNKEEDADNK